MLFLGYSRCSTCQKARKWLDSRNIVYEFREIKEQNPTVDELREWIRSSGLSTRRFVNTSGVLYRSLNLKDKIPSTTDEEVVELLASDGMLVKRPILVDDGTTLVGFNEAEWGNKLGG